MKKTIYALLFGIALFIFATEFSSLMVYGWFLNEKEQTEYMDLKFGEDYELNMMSSSILCLDGQYYIADVPFSVTTKYYIKHVGRVPRWSKLHSRIDEYYDIANE